MQKIWLFVSFGFCILILDEAMAQSQRNFCVTRSRGLSFRVNRGESEDIRTEVFKRCLSNKQTRDDECARNRRCDDEMDPRHSKDIANRPAVREPAPYDTPPSLPNRNSDEILVCELNRMRSSGPNQEAITSYLIDVCKRRFDLLACYSNLSCNDELVYKYLQRCELRGNGFAISAFGIENQQARLNIAQTCRDLSPSVKDCDLEPECTAIPNRPGMDLTTKVVRDRPLDPSTSRPDAPAAPRPAVRNESIDPSNRNGEVIKTPPTPVYKSNEPQPEPGAGVGPFR